MTTGLSITNYMNQSNSGMVIGLAVGIGGASLIAAILIIILIIIKKKRQTKAPIKKFRRVRRRVQKKESFLLKEDHLSPQ
jgi:hypothetical protein